MRLSIFEWIDDDKASLLSYFISAPLSAIIVGGNLSYYIVKQEEIRHLAKWISAAAMFVISATIFIVITWVIDVKDFSLDWWYISTMTVIGGLPSFGVAEEVTIIYDKEDLKKAIATVLVIVVFFVSSSILLDLFFTGDEVETYICYTTDTGDCYHAEYCQYLRKSAHETNVYKAQKDGYRSCSRCTPYEERYATTYQDRNYLVSAILGAIITSGGVVGAICIKKHLNKRDEN